MRNPEQFRITKIQNNNDSLIILDKKNVPILLVLNIGSFDILICFVFRTSSFEFIEAIMIVEKANIS